MQIDEQAPVTARAKIDIAAGPDVLWDLLTTMDKWPQWNPDVKAASQPELHAGATFRWKAGPAALTSTLTEVDRPRVVGWTGVSMGIKAVHVWRLASDGTTSQAQTEESWSGMLPRLMPGMMRKSLQKTLDSWLHHLKIEAETRARG